MSSNVNWPRWIFASTSKYFYDRRGDIDFYIEGQQRISGTGKDLIEFRLDGPLMSELTKDEWYLEIDINLLIQCVKDDLDYYRTHKICGSVAQAFTAIPIYKYGDGTDDDQSQIGCMTLTKGPGRRDGVQINHFGQIGSDTLLMQSSVEGHFHMTITLN